jgi:uncharacterized protein
MHRMEVGGRHYAFLVPSSIFLELDGDARFVLDALESGPKPVAELAADPAKAEVLRELARVGAIHRDGPTLVPMPAKPSNGDTPAPPPLSSLVLNVTNSCNLACRYCYEYGDDRLAKPETASVMNEEVARQSVDLLLAQSKKNQRLQLTFFGGETLLNFKVIQPTVAYARKRAAEEGQFIDFSLTTNATLLTPSIVQWLAENNIGVTVSIDGPKEFQDDMRVYKTGKGSYDVVAPRIKELLRVHRGRPIGARVTVTSKTLDLLRTRQHLVDEMGFYEVGFAPVTSAPGRDYSLDGKAFELLLEQFDVLAEEYVEGALRNHYTGFANLSDMIGEVHQGVQKAYPCGAGVGLLGVAPGGDLGLCHRFAGAGDHDFGHVSSGIDAAKRSEHLKKGHLDNRTDCHTCWARSLCSGGCYHEAQVRYGDRFKPNLHYCDYIRNWTDLTLRSYARILEGNPAFLERFDRSRAA